MLPDLIDKPIYYGLAAITGRHAAAAGLFSGTRTVGHTLLFCLVLVAFGTRSGRTLALAAGVATHLLLDNVGDFFVPASPPESSSLIALWFPAMGVRFPVATASSLAQHLWLKAVDPWVIGGELLGLALLLQAWWTSRARV